MPIGNQNGTNDAQNDGLAQGQGWRKKAVCIFSFGEVRFKVYLVCPLPTPVLATREPAKSSILLEAKEEHALMVASAGGHMVDTDAENEKFTRPNVRAPE